ncbi:hypothetical protein SYK_07160 [Pseudodesulfovibrio nedwellii]|uniref:Uncharacterized protein n=1 Tax=Pseudodesulfovibrio nedwellii TaxID=2973072 RepID=A0ABM8AXW4_9BACT|nr:hypothetical protein [Pseudodesulfovibrio nedwellii]BDQ36356.1 hypothetical protein SYK_07160 [Pseudodesulfovibrio nedwellii]
MTKGKEMKWAEKMLYPSTMKVTVYDDGEVVIDIKSEGRTGHTMSLNKSQSAELLAHLKNITT